MIAHEQFMLFGEGIEDALEVMKDFVNLSDIDMVSCLILLWCLDYSKKKICISMCVHIFVPIVQTKHMYVIRANLKTQKIDNLDNSSAKGDRYGKMAENIVSHNTHTYIRVCSYCLWGVEKPYC
ncbi:unnamed protein product [Cuscuta europaea]|uniref:Uncharacterized protein n=1 Tax=Cuscuta europaea TaxID=41803 RepID=A0A9P0YNT0_CUSEU|nr:unnamed protein product [Cuscuta europaea]